VVGVVAALLAAGEETFNLVKSPDKNSLPRLTKNIHFYYPCP